MLLDLV